MWRCLTGLLLASSLTAQIWSGDALAQSHADNAADLVEAAATITASDYVYPELAEAGAAHIRQRLAEGGYDGLAGDVLADALTTDLARATGDSHIRVIHDPERVVFYRARAAREPDDDVREQLEAARQANLAASRDAGFGFVSIARLPGQVGYVRIDEFDSNLLTDGQTYLGEALRLIDGVDSLVLDLRYCVGGNLDVVSYVLGYLFTGDAVEIGRQIERWQGLDEPVLTPERLPGPRFGDVPVYVLTSGMTFSGGEHMAYHLQSLGRSTAVIGERTYGGGIGWDPVVLNDHFYIRIPRSLVINAQSRTLFAEGAGVMPDVVVEAGRALDQAWLRALDDRLSEADPADEREALTWTRRIAAARAAPDLPIVGMIETARPGNYGPYQFTRRGADLMLSFNGRPAYRLEPLGDGVWFDDRSLQRQFRFIDAENGTAQVIMSRLHDDGEVERDAIRLDG